MIFISNLSISFTNEKKKKAKEDIILKNQLDIKIPLFSSTSMNLTRIVFFFFLPKNLTRRRREEGLKNVKINTIKCYINKDR